MVTSTNKKYPKTRKLTYMFFNTKYSIQSAFRVVLIDFGRGFFYEDDAHKDRLSYVISEILTAYTVYSRYIPNNSFKENIQSTCQKYYNSKNKTFENFMSMINRLFI